jgi:hypothetical protein
MSSKIIPLPLNLKAKLRRHKGNQYQWKHTYTTESALLSPEKTALPLMGLWNSGTHQHLIAADFDRSTFENANLSNADIRGLIEDCFKSNAASYLVVDTPSGGVKVFHWIVFDGRENVRSYHTPTVQFARKYLETLYTPKLLSLMDRSWSALQQTFVNLEILNSLSEYLRSSVPELVPSLRPSSPSSNILFSPSQEPTPLIQLDEISYLKDFHHSAGDLIENEAQARILRILISTHNLASDEGFQLPQTKIAETAKVSLPAVNRYLKKLQDLGVLTKTSDKYFPGVRSKTYKASGLLLKFIQMHKRSLSDKPKRTLTQELLSSSNQINGQFNTTLLRVLNLTLWRSAMEIHEFFQANFESYRTAPPHKKRERLRQIQATFKWKMRRVA